MLISGIVNYNQLHFFGFKKQLIKNTSFNENPQIEKLKCVAWGYVVPKYMFVEKLMRVACT